MQDIQIEYPQLDLKLPFQPKRSLFLYSESKIPIHHLIFETT